ncbi:hypothetical protein CANARDRAFT_27046 [[Candida] arabinofermentans NRRL YB-2248]|uniref:DUF676 domain-containing protein n=1 Tax=[Candida] arabinofermentans NRRL YB-2248 TaxID=983967 RepID=A0A1E4T4M8_9ASCO|nr:hypothetical protein CANARDRAFT_27046 [[Candida] arabinofermentans NRRL YB-2248]
MIMEDKKHHSVPTALLYRSHSSLKIGDVHRYIITYFPKEGEDPTKSLFIKIKNVEMIPLRAAYLAGPYIIYCDVRTDDYTHNKGCFITADQPIYDPSLSAGQSLVAELSLHTMKEKHVWIVDVISQMLFSTSSEVHYEIMLGKDPSCLHRHNMGDELGKFTTRLDVQHMKTVDLWNQPPPSSIPNDPVHLVIITHGLLSNVSADMFYLKEQIELMASKTGENIVVRGFADNVCKTERGVRYLGRRLAEYIVRTVVPSMNVTKISFVAHSLGGLVQTFAIAYIQLNYPEFFDNVKPETFIAMASPFLGISNENPAYVKVALSFGIVGKTGQDLGLQGTKPLLMLLPSEPTRKILRKFKRRTLYANTVHDGIVPLRTSALLYLDWKALSSVYATLKDANTLNTDAAKKSERNTTQDSESVSEIPANVEGESSDASLVTSLKSKLLSPLQTAMAFCLPSMQDDSKIHRYARYQTKDGRSESDDDDSNSKSHIEPLPKSSVIESIKRVVLPPLPPLKYLIDPNSREQVILHDKIYDPDCIPRKNLRSSSTLLESLDPIKRQRILEEKIARRWHNGMTWRKVLVNLLPDAHNNIIVRRRFANAYGWLVVDHMVENHFGERSFKGEDVSDWDWTPSDSHTENEVEDKESQLADAKLSDILIKQRNKASKEFGNDPINTSPIVSGSIIEPSEYCGDDDGYPEDNPASPRARESRDVEPNSMRRFSTETVDDDNGWINDFDSEVYDGAAGMINTVTESVNDGLDAFKKTIFRDSEETEVARNKNNYADESMEDGGVNFERQASLDLSGSPIMHYL